MRYTLQSDPAVQTVALHIFLSALEQGFADAAPRRRRDRGPARSPSSSFNALLNAHAHFTCVVVEGF